MLGIELRPFYTLGKHCTSVLHTKPFHVLLLGDPNSPGLPCGTHITNFSILPKAPGYQNSAIN